MRKKIAPLLVHPYLLSVINLLILILFYSSIKITFIALNPANHFNEAVELWEGYGTILLGFGVLLEERSTLRSMMGINTSIEDRAEGASHDYGVIFVLFGVLVEVFAWLVKIPNEVLDTYGFEFAFINIAGVAAAISAYFQIRFQIALWKAIRSPSSTKH